MFSVLSLEPGWRCLHPSFPHTLLKAWRPEFLSRGGVWPWCDKVTSLLFPRTIQRMDQPKASLWQRGSLVPRSPTVCFSRCLCSVTSSLTVPLVPRPWRCSYGKSLQPSLVHRPEPGTHPLWEQGLELVGCVSLLA